MLSAFEEQHIEGKNIFSLVTTGLQNELALPIGTQIRMIKKLSALKRLCENPDVQRWNDVQVALWFWVQSDATEEYVNIFEEMMTIDNFPQVLNAGRAYVEVITG